MLQENQAAQAEYERQKDAYETEISKKAKNTEMKAHYEAMMTRYEEEMDAYEKNMADYNVLVSDYNSKHEIFEKRKQEIIENEKQRLLTEEAPSIEAEIKQLDIEKQEAEKNIKSGAFIEKYLMEDEDYREAKYAMTLYDCELKELSEELAKQYGILNSLLEPGIIFPKYNDVIAWSTMYEYFMTGRVEGLSGTNGAYNLYESELRANIIIAKMDVIIDKLDQIKDNQYILYNILKKTNEEIEDLNEKMGEMISVSEDIREESIDTNKYLDAIYKTEEGIAYNTKKTAMYTQINARATTAIAFMKAIWG